MKFILRKCVTLLITLFIVSILAFLAFQVIPGDAAAVRLGIHATPESLEALQAEMGLDRPATVQYLDWMGQFLFGDMGQSYIQGMSVRELLGDRLIITGSIMGMSFLLTALIALPTGLLTGRKERGVTHVTVTVLTQITMAVPPLFLGLVLTFVFGAILRLFTPTDFVSFRVSVTGYLGYLFFPAFAIALPKSAMAVRLIRASIRDEMGRDYVRTARSRGAPPGALLYRHILPNIAVPVVTFLILTLIMMVTDSIVVEQVFSIPGAGRLLISAIGNRDFPVVQA
ncbi:MAG: ABC transporter permease, partial [Oscillospiraceae bacterium]|nr:ABC transporter permease [Oscillospiraceae bacterium]